MDLELNEQERAILIEVLESCVSELGMEIADTDRLAFRDQLKRKRAALTKVIEQMKRQAEAP
ncbi:MAG: hypothetical protein CMJ18_23870 [Phycisphaeraceae bacterium]|nr:hypothetical protein [Phycisphaeraceae bacterium]